jgi:hypothetical protein
MTVRNITSALKRVEKFKNEGAHLQALIQGYHLNLQLIRYVLSHCREESELPVKKVKHLVKEFAKEYAASNDLKAVLSKSSFKTVKLWLDKMESFFKVLKIEQPRNVKALAQETMQILHMLNISANKLIGNKPGSAQEQSGRSSTS